MNPASASLPASRGQTIGQGLPAARPAVNEDAELEQIMRDVGVQLKKEDFKKPKRNLLNFGHKPKREVPFTAGIVHNPQQFHKPKPEPVSVQPKPAPRPDVAVASAPQPELRPPDPAEAQLAKIQPHPKAKAETKPKKQLSYPFFVLFVTFLVTGFLIVAAIAAYRQ